MFDFPPAVRDTIWITYARLFTKVSVMTLNGSYKVSCMKLVLMLICAVVLSQRSTLLADAPKGALAAFATKRTWSSSSGFSIDAKMVWADATNVKLEKDDGRVVTVPIDKLSDADQGFVEGFLKAEEALAKANSAASDNPFAGGVPAADIDASMRSEPLDDVRGSPKRAGDIPLRKTIVKGVRPISATPGKEFWDVPQLRGFPDVEFQELVLPIDIPKSFHAGLEIRAAGRSGNAVLSVHKGEKDEGFTKFAVVQASTGDVSETLEIPKAWKMMDISADGGLVAAVHMVGWGKGNDVGILQVTGDGIRPKFQFTAGGGAWDELHFVKFLPGNRLLTITQKHTLTIWQLDDAQGVRAIARGNSGGKLWAAISPAGEVMAVVAGKSIAVVDTTKFKLAGYIEREDEPLKMAFSSDGAYLAAYYPFAIDLYSTRDGSLKKTFAIGDNGRDTRLVWTGEHLLVGNVLYNPQTGVPLWTYEGGKFCDTLGNYLFCAFGGEPQSTVTVLRLPHDEALRGADSIDPNNLYCLQPGDTVSVRYQLGGAPAGEQAAIRSAVETKIAELGWEISSSSSVNIEVSLKQGKSDTAEYYTRRGFGPAFFPPGFGPRPSGPAEKVNFTPWTHTFTITADGSQVYNAVRTYGAPQSLSTDDNETTQQAVSKYAKPQANYFKSLLVPPSILRAEYQGGLGKSRLTASGSQ
ncbi:MAG TPA: hypothetical protein DDW52_25850 [Planctomycetaceae bacterium]|nr:hypothetical protein [Planctomycetaceae bacterium]